MQDQVKIEKMDEPWHWVCNQCGSAEYNSSVSETDVHKLACSGCGGDEWHREPVGSLESIIKKKETTFRILTQGDVRMVHNIGYMLVGGPDAVCFYVDVGSRACVEASTESDDGCPVVFLSSCEDPENPSTDIEFSDFKGWRFHAGGCGKSVAIALVRRGADE